ncbi:MAG: hypothetical protein ACPGSE_00135 [Synechococcus sp.]
MTDNINPRHYTQFRQEVVDTLEDWVARAPDPVSGALQFNAGRYLSRMWDKPAEGGPVEHVRKARWYLERLERHLGANTNHTAQKSLSNYKEILKHYGYDPDSFCSGSNTAAVS